MANTLKFIDMVAKEALAIAHEESQFIGTVDRQYDDSFAKSGAKIGDTLRVRYPNRYKRRQGSRVMQSSDLVETTGNVTMSYQDGVDIPNLTGKELTLDVDNPKQVADFSKRFIKPAMATLVSGIEGDFLAFATKNTPNVAGTAGAAITDLSTVGLARAKLNQGLAPKDGRRYIQGDSVTMASIVNGLKGMFQDSNQIKEQYREGMMGRTAMADWYENDRMWTLSNSGDVAGNVNNGSLLSGITALTVNNFLAAPVAGMVFTVDGVYDCHPETKARYPHLKQFVVTSASTTNIAFQPAMIYDTNNPAQNCSGAPGATSAVVFVGAATTNYVQPLMYHQDAFQFVTASLPEYPMSGNMKQVTYDGLSLRVWMDGDIVNDQLLCRIDIMYGFAALRADWACRMIGAASV